MKTIGIAKRQSLGHRKFLDAIGEVFCVRFEERPLGEEASIDAWFFNEADREDLDHIARSDLPCYAVIRDDHLVPCGQSPIVEFSKHRALSNVLSGRRIHADEAITLKALPQCSQISAVLASKGGAPLWAIRESEGHSHHYVALPVPELTDDEPLFLYFHGRRFLSLLPLLLFLRALTDDQHWEQPPLQACFMLDDANLHWPTYGFIDFGEIQQHAGVHNYHVAMAMIPLDAWFVHAPTASLFKQRPDRLSLLIHGNDHTAQELARTHTDGERSRILRQALGRIGEFERRAGVEVSRTMAPPQGACSGAFLAEMARVGFEAASISRGSLRRHNSQANWLRTLGMRPCDIIGGLPVFPRFPLSKSCHNSILVAALLQQPIIPMGHHQDLADGLQILADLSTFVNTLGTVHWADMTRISRSHYARMIDARILRVRMLTKRIDVYIPEGIHQLLVEQQWLKGVIPETFAWRTRGEGSGWKVQPRSEPIPVHTGQRVEIFSDPIMPPSLYPKTHRKLNIWPFVRRLLTETRDRTAPALHRLAVKRKNT
jgi:hypothetical protein